MKVNNEIAQAIVDELRSSLDDGYPIHDTLIALHNGETREQGAQIAAECLKRVMPDITPDEYVQACSDVLRWYVNGEDLDYVSLEVVDSAIDYHAQRRRHMF